MKKQITTYTDDYHPDKGEYANQEITVVMEDWNEIKVIIGEYGLVLRQKQVAALANLLQKIEDM